jgi:2-C-methyl-D-erythritol 2,4-cyclodiphosphate synthase
MSQQRAGLGFDAHPRDEGRPLRLAGVEFAGEAGLAGHSDGDVVCHALADALLGAAALGDIGQHFPEGSSETAGIAGPELLRRTVEILRHAGFAPSSCDLVVIAERPSVSARREEMRGSLARCLGIEIDRVSVKGTRPEGLGLTGDGIGCMAIATVER